MPINGLPVVYDSPRVFADEIRLDLTDGGHAGCGTPLDNRLPETDDAGVGVHLEEEPARFNQKRFKPGDPERIAWLNRGVTARRRVLCRDSFAGEKGGGFEESAAVHVKSRCFTSAAVRASDSRRAGPEPAGPGKPESTRASRQVAPSG